MQGSYFPTHKKRSLRCLRTRLRRHGWALDLFQAVYKYWSPEHRVILPTRRAPGMPQYECWIRAPWPEIDSEKLLRVLYSQTGNIGRAAQEVLSLQTAEDVETWMAFEAIF